MHASRARGFTLLELLVALAIFAVLATLAYGGVRQLVRLDAGLADSSARQERLRYAVTLMEQDLSALVPRGVRDGLGEAEPALRAGLRGELLTFTRRVSNLGADDGQPALRRVRYRVQNHALYRDVWEVLDRTPDSGYHSQRLLRDVAALELRFFDAGAWLEFWPKDEGAADLLPGGVEFRLRFTDRRVLRRVIARPG